MRQTTSEDAFQHQGRNAFTLLKSAFGLFVVPSLATVPVEQEVSFSRKLWRYFLFFVFSCVFQDVAQD